MPGSVRFQLKHKGGIPLRSGPVRARSRAQTWNTSERIYSKRPWCSPVLVLVLAPAPGSGPSPAGRRRPRQLWLRVGSVGFWSGPAGSGLVLMRLSCFDVRRSKVSGSTAVPVCLVGSAEDSPGEVTSCPGPRPDHVSGFIRFTSLTTRTSTTVGARPLPPSTVQSEAASGSEVKRIEECPYRSPWQHEGDI